jgi:hypothetical protein
VSPTRTSLEPLGHEPVYKRIQLRPVRMPDLSEVEKVHAERV